jgi:hypothetical protein
LRRVAAPGPRDQFADRLALDGARIPVGVLHGEVGGLVDAALGHADLAQRCRRRKFSRQIVEAARGVRRTKCCGDLRHRVGYGRRIVGEGVRENDGVGLRMRQIERPAQRMAELVMQRHADGAEADA